MRCDKKQKTKRVTINLTNAEYEELYFISKSQNVALAKLSGDFVRQAIAEIVIKASPEREGEKL